MDLTPYVAGLRRELAVAAAAGGEDARALADRLTGPLESAVRLALLDALSAAMAEVTRDLAPGSVDVRLRGTDPEFVVTPPPEPGPHPGAGAAPPGTTMAPPMAPPPAPRPAPEGGTGSTTRINLRLPARLKTRVEAAADREDLSVNAWLLRAVALAAAPAPGGPARGAAGRTRYRDGRDHDHGLAGRVH